MNEKAANSFIPFAKRIFKFKVGDIAISNKYIAFTDGSKCFPGQKIKVTEENLAYFHVCENDYRSGDM